MKRFLATLGLLAFIPFFLSRRSRVFRTIWIAAHPAGIFPFIDDPRNWPLWMQWDKSGRVVRHYEGPGAGAGAIQHWATSCTEGTVKILASVPDQRISYAVDMNDGQRHVEGVVTLEPVGDGTRVTWACWWVGGRSPCLRYLDLILRFWTGRDFAAGLRSLKKLVESDQQGEAA